MVEPEGSSPSECYYCHEPFPQRIVVKEGCSLWAQVCLACKRERQHNLLEFPSRYQRIKFVACKINSGNQEAVAFAKEWAEGKLTNLLLWGPPGTGKTHIASAAMYEGPVGVSKFVSVPLMLLRFQGAVKEHEEIRLLSEYEENELHRVHRIDAARGAAKTMLFDDVGAHRISDFGIEMFGILLEKFYSNSREGLIFTSNLSPKQILETMGERVSSRLCGLCRTVELSGSDQRI